MKPSELRQLIKEEITAARSSALIDNIYNILNQVKGFKELGLDQQVELSMKVVQLLKKYGLK
mgnify:CR=1 FL=1